MSIIEINDVYYTYGKDTESPTKAVRGVSLNVDEGEFVAVVGHNGSGKSTLARLMNGLITPDNGSVKVNGLSTSDDKNLFDVRKTVGVVFQNPDNQMVATIIEDDVAFGPENLGLPSEEIRERVDWALKSVGMYEHRGGTPFRLSGGQKQRLCIARALLKKPKILILDDSTSAVDTHTDACIRQALRDEIPDTTKFIIAQRVTSLMDADQIIVLDEGRIDGIGTHEELLKNNAIYREVYESQQKGSVPQ